MSAARRLTSLLLSLVILLCLGTPTAEARTSPSLYDPNALSYYVATTGSDSTGSGSENSPWATITYALTQVPDGSTILVRPGTYYGKVRLDGIFPAGVTVRSEVPYQARLRNHETVIVCFFGQGITLEGFDVAHDGPGAGTLVIQIQDLLDEPGGSNYVSRITLRNNILHDSYNDDILKINNGAGQITVEGNVFYNQTGSDEHIDVNSVTGVIIQDNIFFNDFQGSGRENLNNTGSFIVIKDSNAGSDTNLGSRDITVRRNVFLNWQGSNGSSFVGIGEDGKAYFEAQNVLVENNLMLGNSQNQMRAALGIKGAKNVIFRNNTVSGDLPSLAYAMRLSRQNINPANEGIQFYNNIWSDASGTMGAEYPGRSNDFSDTLPEDIASFSLDQNLYWNGGAEIPSDGRELVNYNDDADAQVGDPLLAGQAGIVLPRWNRDLGEFAGGFTNIRQAFENLVLTYGTPGGGSAAIDTANPANAPAVDILGNPRPFGAGVDLGAYEAQSGAAFSLSVQPVFQAIDTGASAAYTVRLAVPSGFAGEIELSQSQVPDGIQVSLNPTRLHRGESASLVLHDTHSGRLVPGIVNTVKIAGTYEGETVTLDVRLLVGGVRLFLPVMVRKRGATP